MSDGGVEGGKTLSIPPKEKLHNNSPLTPQKRVGNRELGSFKND